MAIALGIAVPTLRPNARARLISAAELLASDLEYAQSLAIASPTNFAMVRFDPDAAEGPTYWIAYESDPDKPIAKLYSSDAHLVTFGAGDAAQLEGVEITVVGDGDRIVFDSFGRTSDGAEGRVRLSNADGSIDIVISATTGFMTVE